MSFQNYRNYYGGEMQQQEWHRRRFWATREEQKWTMPPRMGENGRITERLFEEQQTHRIWEHSGGHRLPSRSSTIGRRQMILSMRELPVDHPRRHPPPLPPSRRLFPPIPPPSPPNVHFLPPPQCHFVPPTQQRVDGQIRENEQNEKIERKVEKEEAKGGGEEEEAQNVDPDQEIVNEEEGFQIRVEAKGFLDGDFKVSIDAARVLALDGEHFEDNGNGTVTIKKLNRRWKLADDIDLHSVRAFLAADGNVEIMGEKKKEEEGMEAHFGDNNGEGAKDEGQSEATEAGRQF